MWKVTQMIGIVAVLSLILARPAAAEINNETAYYHVRLEVTNSVVVCAPVADSGRQAVRVFITVEGEIRYLYHGQSPTSGSGHLASNGTSFALDGTNNVRHLCFIATGDTSFVELTLESP
jgi:hypothetical protein